eukprot:TRINITY_DN14233_c0_g1_i2.p1 TRINITY_DN14233_c0_g1~~TRINITY_DN14233_c0_g1_i2.p1  ORF type:complete len:619 (+),score=180.15 TRINITY_DN14233_c0_g1_i2:91-1857(+)
MAMGRRSPRAGPVGSSGSYVPPAARGTSPSREGSEADIMDDLVAFHGLGSPKCNSLVGCMSGGATAGASPAPGCITPVLGSMSGVSGPRLGVVDDDDLFRLGTGSTASGGPPPMMAPERRVYSPEELRQMAPIGDIPVPQTVAASDAYEPQSQAQAPPGSPQQPPQTGSPRLYAAPGSPRLYAARTTHGADMTRSPLNSPPLSPGRSPRQRVIAAGAGRELPVLLAMTCDDVLTHGGRQWAAGRGKPDAPDRPLLSISPMPSTLERRISSPIPGVGRGDSSQEGTPPVPPMQLPPKQGGSYIPSRARSRSPLSQRKSPARRAKSPPNALQGVGPALAAAAGLVPPEPPSPPDGSPPDTPDSGVLPPAPPPPPGVMHSPDAGMQPHLNPNAREFTPGNSEHTTPQLSPMVSPREAAAAAAAAGAGRRERIDSIDQLRIVLQDYLRRWHTLSSSQQQFFMQWQHVLEQPASPPPGSWEQQQQEILHPQQQLQQQGYADHSAMMQQQADWHQQQQVAGRLSPHAASWRPGSPPPTVVTLIRSPGGRGVGGMGSPPQGSPQRRGYGPPPTTQRRPPPTAQRPLQYPAAGYGS